MQAALVAVLWRGIADGAQLSAGQGRLVTTGDMTTGPKEKGLLICRQNEKPAHSASVSPSPAPAVLTSLISYTVIFFDPFKAPPNHDNFRALKPVIGLTYSTTTALGLGGRQRAVRPVDFKSRSIQSEVVELTFTRAQRTL